MSVQLTLAAPGATLQMQPTIVATNTPEPSNTPTVTATATKIPPTASLTPVSSIPNVGITQVAPLPCDRVDFVRDITIRDYTNFNPGAAFTKTWELRNSGTCTWDSSYSLVFDSGYSMGGPASLALPGLVAPGQLVDLSVTLHAPYNNGTYRGFWKLQNPSGGRFGFGSSSSSPFWVTILVGATPVATYTSTSEVSGSCELVSVSPAANTQYGKGGDFDSKWVIKNTGSKSWLASEVDFKYISGTKMYKFDSLYDLASDVKHNGEITLIVDSIAPSSTGTYTMTWGLVKSSTRICTMSVTIKVK
jgi:hypothetical protein